MNSSLSIVVEPQPNKVRIVIKAVPDVQDQTRFEKIEITGDMRDGQRFDSNNPFELECAVLLLMAHSVRAAIDHLTRELFTLKCATSEEPK